MTTAKKKAAAKRTKPLPVKKANPAASTARAPGAAKSTAKAARASGAAPKSMPKAGKDPRGGLTAEGRTYFARQVSHLRPGVSGAADTPEKMRRKGSFLARTFTHPRGPMRDEAGEPTRLALSAHAWGEPVPATKAAAKKLAAKGRDLLEQFHEAQGGRKRSAKKAAGS